jgi:hypothetical protein
LTGAAFLAVVFFAGARLAGAAFFPADAALAAAAEVFFAGAEVVARVARRAGTALFAAPETVEAASATTRRTRPVMPLPLSAMTRPPASVIVKVP